MVGLLWVQGLLSWSGLRCRLSLRGLLSLRVWLRLWGLLGLLRLLWLRGLGRLRGGLGGRGLLLPERIGRTVTGVPRLPHLCAVSALGKPVEKAAKAGTLTRHRSIVPGRITLTALVISGVPAFTAGHGHSPKRCVDCPIPLVLLPCKKNDKPSPRLSHAPHGSRELGLLSPG